MVKLDLENVRIYSNTKTDISFAFLHLGEEVYLSDDNDFNTYIKGKLVGVSYICGEDYNTWTKYPFVGRAVGDGGLVISGHYQYFILAENAKFKEKNLRPFDSMKEFFDETGFNIGDVIQIKRFGNCTYEEKSIINGFRVFIDEESHSTSVIFGSCSRSFEDLFQNFKYLKNDKWLPFGIGE